MAGRNECGVRSTGQFLDNQSCKYWLICMHYRIELYQNKALCPHSNAAVHLISVIFEI